ncbi:hypothetical protein, partial [Streptomyces brasiliscabiei]|uniref:hypothetical protein n=1 Tax=Streptomyces brasiliscabiei TaxID=2736302 RepID=UPI0030148C3D
ALLSLAWSEAMSGRYQQAMLHFMSAPELNECDQWTLTSAGLGSSFCGNREYARVLVERSNGLPVPPTKPNRAYHATISF